MTCIYFVVFVAIFLSTCMNDLQNNVYNCTGVHYICICLQMNHHNSKMYWKDAKTFCCLSYVIEFWCWFVCLKHDYWPLSLNCEWRSPLPPSNDLLFSIQLRMMIRWEKSLNLKFVILFRRLHHLDQGWYQSQSEVQLSLRIWSPFDNQQLHFFGFNFFSNAFCLRIEHKILIWNIKISALFVVYTASFLRLQSTDTFPCFQSIDIA